MINGNCQNRTVVKRGMMFCYLLCATTGMLDFRLAMTFSVFSERELLFGWLVHPTQAIEIFGNVSTPFGTLAICDPSVKILLRSCQGNPSVGGLNQRGVEKCSDFGRFQGYISETVQDRS